MTIRSALSTTCSVQFSCAVTPQSRAQALQGPAVLAEPVFGSGTATDEFAVLHGLYWLTVNLAEQGPLAILIDDLPWADPLSQRFFAYLAERIDDLPIALVVTIRSGDAGADISVGQRRCRARRRRLSSGPPS